MSALYAGAANAQVVRCKDASGKTIYSDTACGQDGQGVRNLSGNSVSATPIEQPREHVQRRDPVPVASNCPSDREIRNMETSLSSITLQGKDKRSEREFLQAEVRRARACSKEGGNYTAEDWKRVKEAQAAQGNISAADRAGARATAEGIHAPSASGRENDRMAIDKLTATQREIEEARQREERARRAAQQRAEEPLTCTAKGCQSASGTRYDRAAGNSYYRQDGAFCNRIGAFMHCN